MLPTLSFPVGREKVQGLGSFRLVSTGEWWGSGDRVRVRVTQLYPPARAVEL